MADDVSPGEIVRRLDRLEVILLRQVSADVYNRDQRETDRRLTELERDLGEEVERRRQDIKDLRARMDEREKTSGANIRQAIYAGLIPSVLILIGILLQLKGGGG